MINDIKYDYSEEELHRLGFVDADGMINNNLRYEFGLYRQECLRRDKYRANTALIAAGIVDKNGRVLDEKRLQEYKIKEYTAARIAYEKEVAKQRADAEERRKQAIKKFKALLSKWCDRKIKNNIER